ncbi:hypothetical protein ZIOFF_006679 [Zingiber officinale]|uniref:NAD-dependent epimerase/dehydratase domain-containing protein n=1 Tax=Zingiber officinale TaxID=94328 RepID=A0A8J5LP29_ZINOF|nr:hypothetical protein ZIOFF_006679 [Zingiber officinale]
MLRLFSPFDSVASRRSPLHLSCSDPIAAPFPKRAAARATAVVAMSSGKVVCVTGASGYIASWLVKFLLQRGYTVRATVRDPADTKKTEHLRSLDGATERLHLFQANLLEEGSFDAGTEGCDGVFHTASPYYHGITDPQYQVLKYTEDCAIENGIHFIHCNSLQEIFTRSYIPFVSYSVPYYVAFQQMTYTYSGIDFSLRFNLQAELIDPALKGTLNVLASCKKFSIERVVVTSSMAAVAYNGKPRTPDVVVNERWFSSPGFCEQEKLWYVLSKTLAEDAAWKFAKENAMNIVTINPAMVIGPLLQPTLNTSCAAILNLINGSPTYWNSSIGWVNVKDVAMAHILAFEIPTASGRYCLVERVAHYSEVVKTIRKLYPSLQLPEKCADDKLFVPVYQVSKDKYRSLGLDYIPIETSIKETIESLKEKNFVKF